MKNGFIQNPGLIGADGSHKQIEWAELFMLEMVNLLIQSRRMGSLERQREKLEFGSGLVLFDFGKLEFHRRLTGYYNLEFRMQLLGKKLAIQCIQCGRQMAFTSG